MKHGFAKEYNTRVKLIDTYHRVLRTLPKEKSVEAIGNMSRKEQRVYMAKRGLYFFYKNKLDRLYGQV